jgi:HEPN domain-containing protein
MPRSESRLPVDWFDRADRDLDLVDLILRYCGDLGLGAFHVQQGVEKYLKGCLLLRRGALPRVHHLEQLLDDLVEETPELEQFRGLCQEASAFYVMERYPFIPGGTNRTEVEALLQVARGLAAFVRQNYR